MLHYRPPLLLVHGLAVFPDHVDDQTFYYLVAVPELVREAGEPAFWATAVLPDTSVGPAPAAVARVTMSFDVELAATDAALEQVREAVKQHWGREARRLVPAPLHSGTASLQVARPGDPGNQELATFQGQAPSLVGRNRTAFAVAAEGDEAQVMVASLTTGHLAAVVGFDLQLLGLAPSFKARMAVHWQAVYQHLRELELRNFVFVAEEMDAITEQLRQASAVELEVLELDPDGAGAATTALFDELKGEIVSRMFEPPRPLGDLPIEDRIARGVRTLKTSLMPGVSHTLRRLDQQQLTDTVIDLDEQRVRTYSFFPQSTLAGLAQRAGGVGDRLRFVEVGQLPHRVEEVVVEMAAGAADLGVRTVALQVQATDPGRPDPLLDASVLLHAADPQRTVLRYRRQAAEPELRYRTTVTMDPELAPRGQETWAFDWRPVVAQRIWFDPQAWLDVAQVRVELDDPAVLEHVDRVDVDLEAVLDGQPAPFRRLHAELGDGSTSQVVSVVVPESSPVGFRGREIFRRAGEPDFVRELATLEGPVHRVRNPFGQRWSMEVRAVADWTATELLHVELRVWDATRRVWLRDEHRFTGADTAWTARFQTSLETERKAEARVTRVRPGDIVRGPWLDLAGTVVAVTDAVEPLRRVRATLVAPRWEQDEVRQVTVDLEYPHPDDVRPGDGVPASRAVLQLGRDGAVADWVHRFPDPSRPLYRFRVRAVGRNTATASTARGSPAPPTTCGSSFPSPSGSSRPGAGAGQGGTASRSPWSSSKSVESIPSGKRSSTFHWIVPSTGSSTV